MTEGWKATKPASHPSHSLEIPAGFPHSHRFDKGSPLLRHLQERASVVTPTYRCSGGFTLGRQPDSTFTKGLGTADSN
jgi:hypothetical protein